MPIFDSKLIQPETRVDICNYINCMADWFANQWPEYEDSWLIHIKINDVRIISPNFI